MSLQERIADALGWSLSEVQTFSLPALREPVRAVSPKLADEISGLLHRTGEYLVATNLRRGR